jgi:E3 ubiquitin-protein ligase RNF115/126
MIDRDHHDDDGDSIPSLEDIPPHLHDHPLAHHNPFGAATDPEEGDISNLQFRQVGPGRFAMTGTIYRTVSPSRGLAGNQPVMPANPLMGTFASMLNSIVGGARPQSQQLGQGGPPPHGQGPPGTLFGSGSGATPGGHRFTYSSSARLAPRDPDHPGPHLEPVDELNKYVLRI